MLLLLLPVIFVLGIWTITTWHEIEAHRADHRTATVRTLADDVGAAAAELLECEEAARATGARVASAGDPAVAPSIDDARHPRHPDPRDPSWFADDPAHDPETATTYHACRAPGETANYLAGCDDGGHDARDFAHSLHHASAAVATRLYGTRWPGVILPDATLSDQWLDHLYERHWEFARPANPLASARVPETMSTLPNVGADPSTLPTVTARHARHANNDELRTGVPYRPLATLHARTATPGRCRARVATLTRLAPALDPDEPRTRGARARVTVHRPATDGDLAAEPLARTPLAWTVTAQIDAPGGLGLEAGPDFRANARTVRIAAPVADVAPLAYSGPYEAIGSDPPAHWNWPVPLVRPVDPDVFAPGSVADESADARNAPTGVGCREVDDVAGTVPATPQAVPGLPNNRFFRRQHLPDPTDPSVVTDVLANCYGNRATLLHYDGLRRVGAHTVLVPTRPDRRPASNRFVLDEAEDEVVRAVLEEALSDEINAVGGTPPPDWDDFWNDLTQGSRTRIESRVRWIPNHRAPGASARERLLLADCRSQRGEHVRTGCNERSRPWHRAVYQPRERAERQTPVDRRDPHESGPVPPIWIPTPAPEARDIDAPGAHPCRAHPTDVNLRDFRNCGNTVRTRDPDPANLATTPVGRYVRRPARAGTNLEHANFIANEVAATPDPALTALGPLVRPGVGHVVDDQRLRDTLPGPIDVARLGIPDWLRAPWLRSAARTVETQVRTP